MHRITLICKKSILKLLVSLHLILNLVFHRQYLDINIFNNIFKFFNSVMKLISCFKYKYTLSTIIATIVDFLKRLFDSALFIKYYDDTAPSAYVSFLHNPIRKAVVF